MKCGCCEKEGKDQCDCKEWADNAIKFTYYKNPERRRKMNLREKLEEVKNLKQLSSEVEEYIRTSGFVTGSTALLGDLSGGIYIINLRMVKMLNFGQALDLLKLGAKVAREGWNGKDMYLYKVMQELNYPPLTDEQAWKSGTFEESEFIIMKTADKKLIPWLASQTDILAEDWTIIVE